MTHDACDVVVTIVIVAVIVVIIDTDTINNFQILKRKILEIDKPRYMLKVE